MLDKQYNLYSVDTGHFYSNHEKYLHDMNCKYRKERNYINNKLPEIENELKEFGYSDDDIKKIKNNRYHILRRYDIIDTSICEKIHEY